MQTTPVQTIAITAASGSLGAAIIQAVTDLVGKENAIGLARTPSNAAHLGVEVRGGDYNDRDLLEASLQGVNTLLLVSGNDNPSKRIDQHRNVIEAAKRTGVSKIVYTSIQGAEAGTAFSPVVQSNRQTEADVKASGLDWVIGRNGIYIEPDVEYIDKYKERGVIANCAGDARCGYTTRSELAYAYARMLTEKKHNDKTYNLHGEAITQAQLADYLNFTFGTHLTYQPMSVAEYRKERISELGEFMGEIIAGIYEGIREGKLDNESHFERAAGRPHERWQSYFEGLKAAQVKP